MDHSIFAPVSWIASIQQSTNISQNQHQSCQTKTSWERKNCKVASTIITGKFKVLQVIPHDMNKKGCHHGNLPQQF